MGRPEGPRGAAERIVRVLRSAGHVAYFAGGCVRDELLGRDPDDYDVATNAVPERVVELFPRAGEVGKSFGVVIVKSRDGSVEVATFRSDGPYSDRRRPDRVHYSTPEADAQRRDYTVNALFLDPLHQGPGMRSPRGGRVIDYVNGLADLDARLLRAVGDPDARLAEDHLRGLRAARLAAKLGFEVEPATARAVARHAVELRGVSRERVGTEVRRLLAHPSRAAGAGLVRTLGLEASVFLADHPSAVTPGWHRLRALPRRAPVGAALAAWVCDLGWDIRQPARARFLPGLRSALCLSNDERRGVEDVLSRLEVLREGWPDLGVARQKRLVASPGFADAEILLAAEAPDRAGAVRARLAELSATPSGLAPAPLLTGETLIAMGFAPGPGFKAALDAAYDAQLEDRVRTEQEARELAARFCV